jgi:16S rRNA (guanine966-N2)-methyltransferase
VRVIAGAYGGRTLKAPKGDATRPTSDRVREALFSILGDRVQDARVLDLFAGSGALGLEALSRGAREAVLVERDRAAAESLRETVARLHAHAEAQVVAADALAFLRVPLHGRFDIVFVDPPFTAGLWPQVFAVLPPWMGETAWLYVESPADADADAAPGPGFALQREGRTREARHALYRRVTLRADPPEPGVPPE